MITRLINGLAIPIIPLGILAAVIGAATGDEYMEIALISLMSFLFFFLHR